MGFLEVSFFPIFFHGIRTMGVISFIGFSLLPKAGLPCLAGRTVYVNFGRSQQTV